jgi:hypothetical protein
MVVRFLAMMAWYWWVAVSVAVSWLVDVITETRNVARHNAKQLEKQGMDIVQIENMLHALRKDLHSLPAVLDRHASLKQDQ